MTTQYKYSLTSIRNMLNLGHMDIANAIVNNHVAYVNTGTEDSIDTTYTNAKGLAYFRSLAVRKASADMGSVGYHQ